MPKDILSSVFITLAISLSLVACGSGGGSGNSNPAQPVVSSPKKVFVIQQDLSGDLKTEGSGSNGPDGADKLCQADSQSSGGTYKAMLVDGVNRVACTSANCAGGVSEHVDWVLKPSTEYRQIDGSTVIGTTNSAGLFAFPLSNVVSTQSSFLWTGLQADWRGDSQNCGGFASTSGSSRTGSSNATTDTTISWNLTACNYYGTTILCVEQ